ncbi:seed biotin-containing protein SBP65-like [Impatiens glandulifera]|uniref:seed biotin-containing protein SBP65-like n=1 Tax=Impatiens glandulifera TaxID=253017 RepID=UPI001FB16B76|nr:seed biotin-containing protein SBP65-like [Impatiens glandulifera]
MASNQQVRKGSATNDEKDVQINREVVPQKVAHFSALAEKAAGGDHSDDTPAVAVFNEVPTKNPTSVKPIPSRFDRDQTQEDQRPKRDIKSKEEGDRLTPDEITNLKQDAQQKSGEAVKVLGEKYQQVKNTIGRGAETTSQYLTEKATPVKDTLADKTKQAKDTITAAAQQAKEKVVTSEAVVPSSAEKVKGATVGTVQKIGGYVGEKAVAAKDMAVEAGKTTVGYTGKVAVDVKDKAVVAGWGVANFTTEKTVAATKAAAGAVGGVAGYVGEKTGAAKDTVTGFVGEKIVNAKDAVVSAEESLAEYTARKKAEADRELGMKKKVGGGVGVGGGDEGKGEGLMMKKGEDDIDVMDKGGEEGVLQAIGETLVEIAQETKQFVVGSGKVAKKEE